MRPSVVLFILLCVAKCLANCTESATNSSTSFSTSFSTRTTTTTTGTGTDTGAAAAAETEADDNDNKDDNTNDNDNNDGSNDKAHGDDTDPGGLPGIWGPPLSAFPLGPAGLPLAGLPFVIPFGIPWGGAVTKANKTVSYLISLKGTSCRTITSPVLDMTTACIYLMSENPSHSLFATSIIISPILERNASLLADC